MLRDSEWIETATVLLISAFIASIVTVVLFPFLLFVVVWTAVFVLVATLLYYLIEKFKNGGRKWDWK